MLAKLRRYFLSGLIVFLPVALTVYLLVLSIDFADGFLGKYLAPLFHEKLGFYIRGISILIEVSVIILIGFFASNWVGRKLYDVFEGLLLKLPFFRQVYPAIKEIALFLFSRDKLAFKQVVIIEYPRKGLYSFGFLTNETAHIINNVLNTELVNVFIPSAPGPFTGYVIMVPRKDVTTTEISVEEAIKFIVSGGVLNPFTRVPNSGNKR